MLVLGKAGSLRVPPGWFDVLPKNSAQGVMHEWACFHDKAANHHLPIAMAFWIIWIISPEECSSLMQNLLQIHCSARYCFNCHSHTVHMLTQWHLWPPLTSAVKSSYSCMCIPTHSLWLPGYIDVVYSVLIILKMAWLFLDRPCICTYITCIFCIYL